MIDLFQGAGTPLTENEFKAAATTLGVGDQPNTLRALMAVETRGFGFLADRRPQILFERHIFHRRTGGKFSATHSDISNKEPGGYAGGGAEYLRLKQAMLLDRKSALESASWGLGQVMGFNAETAGYDDVDAMIAAFKDSEKEQLYGCVRFLRARKGMAEALKAQNWAAVAHYYNGANYARDGYDKKLDKAFKAFQLTPPRWDVRMIQALLLYAGYDPNGVDGVAGPGFLRAVGKFASERKLSGWSDIDQALRSNAKDNKALAAFWKALGKAAGVDLSTSDAAADPVEAVA